MKKHAYLIIAHNEFHMLKKLLTELDDVRNDIYIHIDRKTKNVDEKEISSWVSNSAVFFVPRIKIFWGHHSIMKCELNMLKMAVKGNYHYYHLISGIDFPLKTQDEIHEFLEDENSEFIECHSDGVYDDHFLYKIKFYYPLLRFVGKGHFDGPGKKLAFMRKLVQKQWKLTVFQENHNFDRTKKYKDITFYKGNQWFSITNDFAKYLVSKEKLIKKMSFWTNGPDEIIIPTIAKNSEFSSRVKDISLRQIDWNRGNPYEYKLEDYNELISSKAFLARKISFNNEPLLVNKLIDRLHQDSIKDTNPEAENYPLISIIVPCYNVQEYINECVKSLLDQDYPNLEILLIDDGSTDGTGNLAKEFAAKNANVIYHRQENGGLSCARNTGIDLSKGEYIAFVDSDDYVKRDYISKLYNALNNSDADISACGYSKFGAEEETVTFDTDKLISSHEAMRILGDIYPKENVLLVIACNKLFKKSLFDNYRFSLNKIHEDEFAAHRLLGAADSIMLVSDSLYLYRIRENSITGGANYQSIKHMDYIDALYDRLLCMNQMMFNDLFIFALYTYFEGIKHLMSVYDDENIRKYKLYSQFRKRAAKVYFSFFTELDSYQKRDYLKMIINPKKYRQNIINLRKEK